MYETLRIHALKELVVRGYGDSVTIAFWHPSFEIGCNTVSQRGGRM